MSKWFIVFWIIEYCGYIVYCVIKYIYSTKWTCKEYCAYCLYKLFMSLCLIDTLFYTINAVTVWIVTNQLDWYSVTIYRKGLDDLGHAGDVTENRHGNFYCRCHVHTSMLLYVHVYGLCCCWWGVFEFLLLRVFVVWCIRVCEFFGVWWNFLLLLFDSYIKKMCMIVEGEDCMWYKLDAVYYVDIFHFHNTPYNIFVV